MEYMSTAEIREKYLSFFEAKGCKRVALVLAHPRRPVAVC